MSSTLSRRAFVGGAAASLVAGRTVRASEPPAPVLFVSHGSPLYAPPVEKRIEPLAAWGRSLPAPRGIVVMTPHFAARTPMLGPTARGFAMYDLPRRIKRLVPPDLDYPSPPSALLGARVESLFGAPLARPARRGFDHTTWMPLLAMLPAARAPVVEVGYPYLADRQLFELGRRLAPLREEGMLFVASGGMTHNLAAASDRIGVAMLPGDVPAPAWAVEFEAWATERLSAVDVGALVEWRARAPGAELAHPDDGAHFRVLLVALGVALGGPSPATRVSFPVTGLDGALSARGVQLG